MRGGYVLGQKLRSLKETIKKWNKRASESSE